MKIVKHKHIFRIITAALFMTACNEGIDPISPVAPGADTASPTVTIRYPGEGTLIRVREEVASIRIELDVTDDIEISSVVVKMDNNKVTEYTTFKDYRHLAATCIFDGLTNGSHTLTIEATDLSGKTASASSTFEKVEPYRPVYLSMGEIFYMPLDGDCLELISIIEATKVGAPSFAAGKIRQAYVGAPDAYLSFSLADFATPLAGSAAISVAFWYKRGTETRAGIISCGIGTDAQENGFVFFREGDTYDTFQVLAGDGTDGTWGGGVQLAEASTTEWVHIAFTIGAGAIKVYCNGVEKKTAAFASPIGWAGCSTISIGSGAPTFGDWNHLGDNCQIDELRIFNKALSPEEVLTLKNAQ
jgi:hypothetical protein